MRRFRNLGLSAALEAEEAVAQQEAEAVGEVVEDTIGDNAESLETELLEGSEVVEDNEVLADQIDEATDVAESLDEYEEAMESIIAQGGLDRNGARLLSMGLESLQARVGVVLEKQAMPSLESFGGSGSRIEASKYALENIKETAGKVWDAIIAGIMKAIEAIKNVWKYMTDGNVRLKARAEKLLKAAETKNINSAKLTGDQFIKKESIIRKVSNSGNVPFDNSVKNFGEVFANAVKDHIPSMITAFEKINSNVIQGAKDPEVEELQFDPEVFKQSIEVKPGKIGAGNLVFFIQETPKAKGTEGIKQIGEMKIGVGTYSEKVPNEIKTLEIEQIKTVLKTVLEVSANIDKMRGLEKQFTEAGNKVLIAAKTFAAEKELNSSESGEKVMAIKRKIAAAKIFLTRGFNRVGNIPGLLGNRAFGISKGLLDYCEVSLKQYK